MIKSYLRSMLPPYSRKDALPVAVMLFILLMIPLTIVFLNRETIDRSLASSETSIEPESGVISGNVQIVNDAAVSGGKYATLNYKASSAPTPTVAASLPPSCNYAYKRLIQVATTTELKSAVSNALPGDLIAMADGTYTGRIDLLRSGTAADRITLCGNKAAKITGTTITSGDVVALKASYWNLSGFSLTNAIQGLNMQNANFNIVRGLEIYGIGQAAIHTHVLSSDNTLENNYIHDTGKHIAEFGEGIYIGTANTQWCTYTNCQPDRSDRNRMTGNIFGSNVKAENIDIKEGTSNGVISGNTFSGVGQSTSPDFLDSWVDIKGSRYTVSNNTGTTARRFGFEVNKQVTGSDSGDNNVFMSNTMNLNGGQYGIKVGYNNPVGTVVKCNNTVTNATAGLSNISCQQ